MTGDERAELAALRLRAYGPHADIAGDPVALARLDVLEGRRATDAAAPAATVRTRSVLEPPVVRPADDPATDSGAVPEPGDGSRASDGGEHDADGAASDVSLWRRMRPRVDRVTAIWWIASLVVVAGLSTGTTLLVTHVVTSQHAAVLQRIPGDAPSAVMFTGTSTSSQAYESYLGMSVYTVIPPAGDMRCIAVIPQPDVYPDASLIGCALGTLPVVVDVRIGTSADTNPLASNGRPVVFTPAVEQAFPDGADLRFTARDDTVTVDAYPVARTPVTPNS
ncbi:MAG: hypothetical protein CMH36_12760 [Microbacterium sp.]|uniref:hypothetical protein n=1 Tax=uncultured Microbacterium sp. TaxID=191216 RepID=UPI000C908F9B|nr:hypothetical protein [uncultured Microbacterium sp.]MAL07676.1 hypothetical protein [Microbacterium sp.]